MAALAAVGATDSDVDLVSDSRCVVNGIAATGGARADEWSHADVWERLAPQTRIGRLRARWMPAHLEAEAYTWTWHAGSPKQT